MDQPSRSAGTVRPGGRTARVRAAVLEATQDELVERGFHGLTMDQVAARAGVGKTTVYRRWGSTPGLVADLMNELANQSADHADTGSVEEDLRANALAVLDALNDGRLGVTFQAVIAAATSDEQAAQALRGFYLRRIEEWAKVVDLAVRRGELPEGTDGGEVIRAVSAPLYYRLVVTREPVTRVVAEQSVARTLAAARAGAFVVAAPPG
ncbi:TetR/AcrR family transcriptional regulator [Nonomuraea gerenzanensis]|uniref:Transcriptional regulator, TetR family n=1 Tax=Nonomuraea gerenzanensis TaxID=93944 RepID=A0A1M4E264_9ACTN|nr:TetR/AcrR family transcriptional regulator [Nonomuraea gerenzanensis]UBU15182.1 TetR/AcrR family transcriptional regulator [Nonomuraea gerenzanensis]SBO92924.1 Transcriptional regulator, TetR family [Nonomuraea gerenzanensis]